MGLGYIRVEDLSRDWEHFRLRHSRVSRRPGYIVSHIEVRQTLQKTLISTNATGLVFLNEEHLFLDRSYT